MRLEIGLVIGVVRHSIPQVGGVGFHPVVGEKLGFVATEESRWIVDEKRLNEGIVQDNYVGNVSDKETLYRLGIGS